MEQSSPRWKENDKIKRAKDSVLVMFWANLLANALHLARNFPVKKMCLLISLRPGLPRLRVVYCFLPARSVFPCDIGRDLFIIRLSSCLFCIAASLHYSFLSRTFTTSFLRLFTICIPKFFFFLILFIALLYCFFFSYDMYFIYHTFPFIFTAFIHIFIYQKLQSRHTELDCILHIFQS